MKISIRDISAATGFSPATVSNALNHKSGVNKATAQKVLQAAADIGYLNERKISKIKFVIFRKNGLIIDDSQFHPTVISGVEAEAKEAGYETIFVNLDRQSSSYEQEVREILDDPTSAVILLGTEITEEDYPSFEVHKCQLILLDGWSDQIVFNSVLIANTDSANYATRYLIRQGHKKIGYIRGNFRISAFRYREVGYMRAMVDANLPVNRDYIVTVGTKMATAYQDMLSFLEQGKDLPTAFFADNDEIAMGAMRALKEKGYRIPEDISIIGFDDIAYDAISSPPLSTVHVYKSEMGRAAVKRLCEMMAGDLIPQKIQLCTSFIPRGSVKSLL